MSTLDIRSISKQYPSTTPILKELSLTMNPGEIHLIYGRSGSGKTTLLNCISGVETIQSGHIYINDSNMTRLPAQKRADFRLFNIGILYQFFNLLPSLSLKENILLPSNLQEHTDNSIFIELINYFGISEIINKYPEQCSGGECQRAALCRALICKPSLILADEPTGNLDIDNRDRVLSYLEKLAKSKTMAILIATHDPDIKAMANYVWSLESGSLVQS